jgi:hypothetical protein
MLERAWERWRVTQGLEAEPLPPVSSYVGYSIEEPWGRPRVVFGVDAEDAERLAALLQHSIGHGPDGLARPAEAGHRPPNRGFAADRPAGPDRGYDQSLLDDVRGRIPVQGWPPEFSESREQLNSSGPSHPDEPQLPLDLGPAQADGGAGEPFRWEPDRPHDLKLPGELGLSDEFRASDDHLDDQPGLFGGDAPNGDARYGDARYGNAPYGDVRHGDVRHENAPYENAPYGDAPYGVPYVGDAPYAVPYTGEPYDPEGAYGPYGRGESDDVPGGAPSGYSAPGGYSAASGYSAPGGYGGPGPHRAEDESANGSREASYRAPGTSELPESDGQSGQPSWTLNGGARRDGKPDEGAAATPEVRPEAGHDDELPGGESERDEATEDVLTGDVSVRAESVRAESVRAEPLRAGGMPDADQADADQADADEADGDEPGGDMRGGDDGPGDDTSDPNAGGGKHMLAGDVAPQKDAHGSDAFSGGATGGAAPGGGASTGGATGGAAPGGAASGAAVPSGKAWGEKTWGEKTLSRDAGPDETPPAAAQPAGEAPRAAADRAADPASRGSITDTMAAELAGWAAGELPGQAAARLASWATAGGAVARGRQQARLGGGGTATGRAS